LIATEVDIALPITVAMRTYFSTYHLWGARHFTRLAAEIEANTPAPHFSMPHRCYVTNAVLSAAAFLDAAINEVFEDIDDSHPSYVDALSVEDRSKIASIANKKKRGPTLAKYQAALDALSQEQFIPHAAPYEDASLVIELRNRLMHFRPETISESDLNDIDAIVFNKFEPNRLMKGQRNPYFPDHCLGGGCAAWAAHSVMAFTDEFFDRVRMKPHYQRSDLGPA
jgi:hypothetical protein